MKDYFHQPLYHKIFLGFVFIYMALIFIGTLWKGLAGLFVFIFLPGIIMIPLLFLSVIINLIYQHKSYKVLVANAYKTRRSETKYLNRTELYKGDKSIMSVVEKHGGTDLGGTSYHISKRDKKIKLIVSITTRQKRFLPKYLQKTAERIGTSVSDFREVKSISRRAKAALLVYAPKTYTEKELKKIGVFIDENFELIRDLAQKSLLTKEGELMVSIDCPFDSGIMKRLDSYYHDIDLLNLSSLY